MTYLAHETPSAINTRRINIVGASGSGATTLARALADALALPCHDADDYFWRPTTPPYRERRPPGERARLMREMFVPRPGWIVSGSVEGWGDEIVALFDLVVFLRVASDVRLARLLARETRRFGVAAVTPGGGAHQNLVEFLAWAGQYDTGTSQGRDLAKHEAWLAILQCPILRLDGTCPTAALVADVVAGLPV